MQRESITVAYGKLRLRTLSFTVADGAQPSRALVRGAGADREAELRVERERVHLTLPSECILRAGDALEIEIS